MSVSILFRSVNHGQVLHPWPRTVLISFYMIYLIIHLIKTFFLYIVQLQDTETTSGESEVKFQVSRDTLGAMLRSMAYIREQLSNAVR